MEYVPHVFPVVTVVTLDFASHSLQTHSHANISRLSRTVDHFRVLIQLVFSTGSGSLAAMAVFEDRYKPDMEVSHSLTTDNAVKCVTIQDKQARLPLMFCAKGGGGQAAGA